jgi:hypothetical protein
VAIVTGGQNVADQNRGNEEREKLLSKRHFELGLTGLGWALGAVILATQEAAIRSFAVRSQPRQIVRKTLS